MTALPFIIVDGPDCAGKTTLVHRLRGELGWDAKFLNQTKGKPFPRYAQEYDSQQRVIFERCHLSEEVYSTLWRGGNPFSFMEKRTLDEQISSQGLVIFACPDVNVLRERYQARNHNQKIRFQELERAHWLFNKAFEYVTHIKYTSKDWKELDELVKKVKEEVDRRDSHWK
jgi:thymidylate kinase